MSEIEPTPQKPKPGDRIVDARALALIDRTRQQSGKLTKVRDGYDKAVTSVLALSAEQIASAGLDPQQIIRLGQLAADDEQIELLLPVTEKLLDMLHDTQLDRRHQIGVILGELAAQGRRRAERHPRGAEILGPLDKLMDYQFGPALKAAATRARNAQNGDGTAGRAKTRAKNKGAKAKALVQAEAAEVTNEDRNTKAAEGTDPGQRI